MHRTCHLRLTSRSGWATLSRSKKNPSQEKSRIKLTLKCSTFSGFLLWTRLLMACFSLSFGLLVGKCVGKAQPELTNRAVLEHLECPVRNGGGCWTPRIPLGFVCLKYKGGFSPCFEKSILRGSRQPVDTAFFGDAASRNCAASLKFGLRGSWNLGEPCCGTL